MLSLDLELIGLMYMDNLYDCYCQQSVSLELFQPCFKGSLPAGFQLDEMAFSTLFRSFDPECTDWLSMAEYIAMTLFLQSASATFEAFDNQQQGTVTLNFNQWIYATANVV